MNNTKTDEITFTLTIDDIQEVVADEMGDEFTCEKYRAVARYFFSRMADTCLRSLAEHLVEQVGEDPADVADEVGPW